MMSRRFRGSSTLYLPLVLALSAGLFMPAAGAAQSASSQGVLSELHWRSVGPYIGGRVVAVAGVPGQPNLFYMGGVDAGVWKSTDYGLEWKNITDGKLPGTSASIGAIAVAPSNSKVIYVGTGESDIRGDMISGDGVFRSTDGGVTWSRAGLEDTHTISNLVVDPKDPDVVYASSLGHVFVPGEHRGVFKTTDGGHTWKRVLFVNDSTGVVNLVMVPGNPDVLYAAAWQAYRKPWVLSSGGAGSGIYESTDGGEHWKDLTHNPGLPKGVLGKIGVAVAASAPNVVYATIQAKEGGVFRSDNGGATWKRVNKEWKLRQRAFYYMAIFVDPTNPNTVYMPQVDALYASHDGAKSFMRLHTPHGDNHIVWINPDNPKILLEGNDGGATVSTDGGRSWSTEHNQPTGQFYHVSIDHRFPFHIFGAQQDEGSVDGPSATADGNIPLGAWKRAAYGESTPVVPDPNNPEMTYGSGYFSIFLKYDQAIGQYQSASPWPNYQEGASSGELKYRFAWTHPILFSPNNPNELFIGSQYVMRSLDHGNTWQTLSPDLTRNDPSTEAPSGGPIDLDQSGAEIYPYVSALAVSPLDDSLIWAGSSDGLVHVTTDEGQHWQEVRPPTLPKWAQISSIEPSHVDRGTAYLTARRYMWDDFTPYVFKTTDFGKHWTAITDGVPNDEYAFAIRQDPDDANLLFLGTKSTVYVSLDGGAHWQSLTHNLPRVQVRDVAIDNRQGDVVVATHGRSFWVLDNLSLLEQMTKAAAPAADDAALFAPQTVWLSHVYGGSAYGGANSGQNPAFGATVFFQLPKSYDGHTPVTLSFTDANGTTIRSFHLHLKEERAGHHHMMAHESPAAIQRAMKRRLTAVTAGANHFQWNLRYPDATEVTGFYPPVAAGGLPDGVEGPVIVPGSYHVVLEYGSQRITKPFVVSLDPRIHVGQAALQQRLDLQLQIHKALDSLDRTLNQTIALRDSLVSAGGSADRVAALTKVIHSLVQMNIRSSEGSLLHETKLRSHLAYLAADIDLAYAAPTPPQQAVFKELAGEVQQAQAALQAAMAKARGS